MQKEISLSPISNNHYPLLSLAALFEEKFSIDWLFELTGKKPMEVLSALEGFVNTGWLTSNHLGIYCFSNNSKKQQQADILTPEEKDVYIRRIVTILQNEPLDEDYKAKQLSYYLLQIKNGVTGCCWLKKASDAFRKSFDTERFFKCAVKIFDDLLTINNKPETAILFMETAHQYAKTFLANQNTGKVLSILQNALNLAVEFDNPKYQALMKMDMFMAEWFHSRYDNALQYFEEGRALAENLGDPTLLRKANMFHTAYYFWQGYHKEVIKNYENFVPELMRFPEGRFPLLGVLVAGLSYVQTGQLGQGLGLMDALRKHAQEIGDHLIESHALSGIGLIMLDIRKHNDALPHFELGLEMSLREENGYMAILCRLGLALCHFLNDEKGKAAKYLCEFVNLSKEVQINSWPHPYFLELCWAIEQGELPAIPGTSLKEEVNRLTRAKSVFMQGLAYRYKAFLEIKEKTDNKMVMQSLNLSLQCLEAAGSSLEASRTQLEIARQYLRERQEEQAKQVIEKISKILLPLNEALIPDDLRHLVKVEENTGGFLLKEILNLGKEIVNIRESRDLMLKIISSVCRITGAERGAIFLWNESQLDIKASKNILPEQVSHSDFEPSLKVIEEVASTAEGCIKKFNSEEKIHSLLSKGTFRTVICVPMILRDQVKGVLYLDNRILGSSFKASDLELLSYFAALAAIAIDNVTSYEEIQLQNQKLIDEKNYFEEEYRFSKISVENIIGKSAPIKQVLHQIQTVAPTDSTVLILGDTGVGKELVASAIHQHSSRSNNSFICVQCSALPEKLLPSELFGHEKGAFTGAVKRRIGRFELAHKGTIFLDEIGDLQPDMQVQLLRVLETKQFERIGGSETLHSDFRLIAATNCDLKKMSNEGTFRRDLYYRLNVFPIHVPSLMERKKDIPLLVDYFVKIYSQKLGKTFEKISPEDMKIFFQYDWPGNIRELENIVERAIISNSGPVLRFSGLLPPPGNILSSSNSTLSLIDNERIHISRVLQTTKGKVRGPGGAAEILNINPSTLFSRIKKLGITRSFA